MKIGVISDTHGYLDPQVLEYFKPCDEIWHAGDFGSMDVADALERLKPLRGVYGNIDGSAIRQKFPEMLEFDCAGVSVMMIHIGGSPPRYNPKVRKILSRQSPAIFVCGHSHILKVMADKNLNNMLYMNPGAAGVQGFHKMRTMLRFDITDKKPGNLEVIQLGLRGELSKRQD